MIKLLVCSIERIKHYLWDTWICVEIKSGINYDSEKGKEIEREILEYVNKCETDEFYNSNTGNRKYKYASPQCECSDSPETKEHWILSNHEIDKGWFYELF